MTHLRPLSASLGRFLLAPVLCLSLVTVLWGQNQVQAESKVQLMAPFVVKSSRLGLGDTANAEGLDLYGSQQLFDSGAFGFDDFLETLPPDRSGGQQLVLVDGKPTYLDLSKIPLDMIEGIEISKEGSMPKYGAYASGRIINVRLKKNYRGAESSLRLGGSFEGGAFQRRIRFSGTALQEGWKLFFALDASNAEALYASQRSFSRNQDHRAQGGRNLLTPWGSTAVIQALEGTLPGIRDDQGAPNAVALVPEGGANNPGAFLPGVRDPDTGLISAAFQRSFNSSPYRMLSSPGEQKGINLSLGRKLGRDLEFSITGSFSRSSSDRIGPPPVTPTSASTVVPAGLNPFGKDIMIGLVHLGFGPTRQESWSDNSQLGLRLSGKTASAWNWSLGTGGRFARSSQQATDLDKDRFSAALRAVDYASRFDPFGGAAAEAHNTLLYPSLRVLRSSRNRSSALGLDASASGPLAKLAAGPLTLSLNSQAAASSQERSSENSLSTSTPDSRSTKQRFSNSAHLNLPLYSKENAAPLRQRLDFNLSTALSGQDDDSSGKDLGGGLSWAPIKNLFIRSRLGWREDSPPSKIVAAPDVLVRETLIDPRRPGTPASEVQILTRDEVPREKSTAQRLNLFLSYQPVPIKGLELSLGYQERTRKHLLERSYDPQDVLNNESSLPGRVQRASPNAQDLALGQPGTVLVVDTSPGNTGTQKTRSLEMDLEYSYAFEHLGRLRLSGFAERILEASYEIAPGVNFVHNSSSNQNPALWSCGGTLMWNLGAWSSHLNYRYTSPPIHPSLAGDGVLQKLDLNFSYQFRKPFWGKGQRGPRILLGLGNVLAGTPPFADTLNGFRTGSAQGRSYSLTLMLPL